MTEISIITTTLNAGETLETCIHSVSAQSVGAEHIVVDAGSTDGTPALLQENSRYFAQVLTEPGAGIYEALNKGIEACHGDIIGILHADDFYPSANVLSRVQQEFSEDIDACYGDLVYVSKSDINKVVRYWRAGGFDVNRFYQGWMPPHPTFFVRRRVYDKYGLFRTDLRTAADYELMLRFMLKHRINVAYIPEVLVHMRTGGVSNRSLLNRIRANRMDRLAWEINDLTPGPWTLFMKPLRKVGQWIVKK